jgi:integrase
MEEKITKTTIDRLAIGATVFDTEVAGFHARRLPSGKVSYGFRYRTADGKRPMISLGLHGSITPDQARTLAKKRAGEVADHKDPASARDAAREQAKIDETKKVDVILDQHIEHHVNKLKSADTVISAFRRSVRPAIGNVLIYDVKREDIIDLLDDVEEENGPVQADRTLAYIRKAFNWYMIRDTKFVSPIIKGMNRTDASERRGKRILTDEEIRDIWIASETCATRNDIRVPACTAQFVRLLFLTAQRRTQVARWHVDQIDRTGWMETGSYVYGEGWIVEAGDYKNGETQLLPITEAMREHLKREAGFLVSSDDGKAPMGGFSKVKLAIDAELQTMRERDGRKAIPKWTFHDIRRTARSIMSRYTNSDIAERVIGHVIPGVRGVYDHYDFMKEKREALEKLAVHVLGVVHADPHKVVPLRASGG